MNERIRELAEQATTIVEMVGPQGYASSYAKFDREKFAELIVKDVLDEVLQAMDDGMDIYDTVADKFGVEE
jgi:hypothetical protein